MKRFVVLGLPLLFSVTVLAALLLGISMPTAAQKGAIDLTQRAYPPPRAEGREPLAHSIDMGGWQYGPVSTFQYQRFDGVFVPGLEGQAWANKVYFMGGRTSPSTELPNIWVFNPLTGVYTDTLVDMIEDVSNYNTDLILDDGTGRGPAVYVVGGYDRDTAGANIGLVQRYYPQLSIIEALPPADDWPGTVAGITVGGMGTAVVNDIIYVFGGWESSVPPYFSNETWLFDPSQPSGSRWTNLGVAMSTGRSYIQSAMQDGKIYAMGGISQYIGGDLVPTDFVEVLDTGNLAVGWNPLSPMPVAIAEGRGFGFDDDTLGIEQLRGRLYVVGGGDWPDTGLEVLEYFVATDTWNQGFPDLNEDRVNHAGVYIPLYTPDPNDGLPGMWVFGGRWDNGCYPPYGPTEYYSLQLPEGCNILLVDDDWDFGDDQYGGGRPYYTSTLEALGYPYTVWDTGIYSSPTAMDMEPYDVVVWFTGYDYVEPVTGAEEDELITYLQGGGNLFMSDQEQYWAFGLSPLMTDYFWVDSVIGDVVLTVTQGSASDPLFAGLGPYDMGRPDQWSTYWPTGATQGPYDDEIFVKEGGFEPLIYTDSGNPNSTRVERDAFKTIYLGFPFEWLPNTSDRMEILNAALGWMCAPSASLIPTEQSGYGLPGTTVPYTLTIMNDLGYDEAFIIAYDAVWTITGPISVGPIPSGQSLDFEVIVEVPSGADCYDIDTAIVTAVAANNQVFSDTAYIETGAGPFGMGALGGHVYDTNTGLAVSDAHVSLEKGAFYTETWSGLDGSYAFAGLSACMGNYNAGFDAAGYYGQTGIPLNITASMTTTLDAYLNAGMPVLSESEVRVTIPPTSTGAYSLTLNNTGTGDLIFQITENAGVGDIPWLEVAPTGGSIAPMSGEAIVLAFDTNGLNVGECYTGTLLFEYNDPYTGEEVVLVEMCVDYVADLEVSMVDDPDPVDAGGLLTYMIVVENLGPNDATGVVVTDTLDASVTYNSSSWVGCTGDGGVVTCDIDDLAPGQVVSFTIAGIAPEVAGVYVNHVVVAGKEFDTELANNSASEETTVTGAPKIYLPIIYRE